MVTNLEKWLLKSRWRAPFIIAFLVFLIFIQSLPNKFVLDDPAQVTNNTAVTTFNLPYIFLGSSFGVGGGTQGIYYKPMMSASYAFVYRVFGPAPWGFHLLQVLLQMANGILVYYIFRRFFGGKDSIASLRSLQNDRSGGAKVILPLFLALVFALHPFNSEAVLYISNLQDLLFFFFGSLAFLLATGKKLGVLRVVSVGVLILMSLLSKETGVVFIPVIVLYTLFFNFGKKKRWEGYWLFVTLGTVFAFYFLIRLAAVGLPVGHDHPYPIMRLTFAQRLINIPAMFFYYVRNFLAPYDFAVAQHWVVRSISWGTFWGPLLVDALFVGGIGLIGVVGGSSRRRVYGFFLGWFCFGMMLHLNIFPLDVTVADRWFYFPSVGLLGIIGLGLMAGTRSLLALTPARRDLVLVFGIGILLVLSARTFVRVFDWRDGLTLATREVRYSKDSFPLENNLAYELINANRYEEALVHAKRSTALGPWWWLNWTNLGVIYRHLGKTDLAIESFGRGADNTDVFLVPYENKAEMLINYRSPEETVSYIVKSSKKAGTSGRLLFLLALALSQTGDTKGALDSAHRAVLADPADAKAQMLYEGLKAGKKVQIGKTVY